jgi:hypothetical protein
MPEETPASTDALLLQTLKRIEDSVGAMRGAFDAEKESRHAHESLVDAQIAALDAEVAKLRDEREEEKKRKVGYVTIAIATVATALGSFVTWLAERLMTHH